MGCIFLGAALIAAPFMHPLVDWSVVLLTVFVMGIASERRVLTRPTLSILMPAIVAVCALPSMLVMAGFAKFDVYAVVHHIQFGMMDADLGIVLRNLAPLIAAICIFILGLYVVKNTFAWGDRIYWYGAVLVATINPLTINLFEIMKAPNYDSDLSERIQPPTVLSPGSRADVVLVYLEGLDRSFANRNAFGDIYMPLEVLGEQGLTFTGVRQVQGTGWSLAGLVATQCGLPLVPNGLRNFYKFEMQTAFLADHLCLTDVLADQGYSNTLIVGGSIGFGGQDHFLASHQFDGLMGKQAISDMFDEETIKRATAARNLDDQLVFDVALDIYADLVSKPEPFAMTVETIGPHGDSGTLSRNCTADGQAVETGDLHATVSCTLSNMTRFLDGLRELRNNRPTLVVIMSDHLNHAWPKEFHVAQGGRTNTVMMLGLDMPDVGEGITIDRPASMIDVYPTILTLLGQGGLDARAGLGVSLLGSAPTLVEEKGFVRLNHELTRNYELSQAVWGVQ